MNEDKEIIDVKLCDAWLEKNKYTSIHHWAEDDRVPNEDAEFQLQYAEGSIGYDDNYLYECLTADLRDNPDMEAEPIPVVNYVKTVQIGFDIAIPEGMTAKDVEEFMQFDMERLISQNSGGLVVLNSVYSAEDMSHAYDIKEVNKMFNGKRL